MKRVLRYAALVAAAALLAPLQAADEPGITRKQADDILQELRQIRSLLEKQAQAAPPAEEKPSRAKLNLAGTEMLGSKDAPITMVEFTDYQCPFCQRFHLATMPEIKKNYIDTGKVRFFSRDLPLDTMHPNAMRAAQSARCAGEQGQFWAMRDVLAANPGKLDLENVLGFAGGLKLDTAKLKECIESEKFKPAVQKDLAEAMAIGATGTPSFVIGKSTPEGVDGELVMGALPYNLFDQKLKSLE
jgi:protein-disulfide isomerase